MKDLSILLQKKSLIEAFVLSKFCLDVFVGGMLNLKQYPGNHKQSSVPAIFSVYISYSEESLVTALSTFRHFLSVKISPLLQHTIVFY